MIDLSAYTKVNESFRSKELIFHVGCDSGFYSEFNNMILAMIYCLQHKIKFSLYSADANFGYKLGWRDYFLPFCEETSDSFHHKFNVRGENPWFFAHGMDRWRYLLWRFKHKRTYLTSDVFCRFRLVSFEREKFIIPELGLEGDLRSVARELIEMVYRYNKEVAAEILEMKQSLALPDKFVGLHIRGGDKFVEHKLENYSTYILKAENLSPLRDAFVSTDDYRIIEGLKRDYPNWRFYTLTDTKDQGYFHSNFQAKDKMEKRMDIVKLLASIDVLKNSELFVGTFSSNPGMFLGMCKEQAFGIDFGNWLLW